jgi:tetratricopeptide (TPR) repeat protein
MASALSETLRSGKRDVVLGNEEWCTALWGKGFGLIDLNRSAEAGPFLAKAVEMDPGNAHFINEYAEWFKAQQQFKRSKELFTQAWETVGHDKQGPDRKVAARSLRGIAFDLIELGDLDGAEKLYRQSLEYEHEAKDKVQQELDYLAEQRAKLKKPS